MNQRLFLVISSLFMLTVLLWQRSLHTHYAYTLVELEKEKVYLGKQVKTLEMEINQLATPDSLYKYWQENEDQLNFIQMESPESVPLVRSDDPALSNQKKSKSKVHNVTLRRSQP